MMAAEELGRRLRQGARRSIGDTGSLGYNFLTGGSRVDLLDRHGGGGGRARGRSRRALRARRQALGAAEPTRSSARTARCSPAGANAGKHQAADAAARSPASRRQDRRADRRPRGASTPHGAGAELRHPHRATSRSIPRPARVDGPALHRRPGRRPGHPPELRRGPVSRAASAQGIGWALNEEYIYGADGKLQNAGFLDYRMPVASDLPMIDTVIVEVPNPRHPYGVRGVGETPIVPPLAAIANAVAQRHRHALHRAADVAAQGAGGARRGPGGQGSDVEAEDRIGDAVAVQALRQAAIAAGAK